MIRQRTGDSLCLDDLMRHLWQRFGKVGNGLPERALETELLELTDCDFGDFFARYVYGVDDPPWNDWFSAMGIGFRLRAMRNSDDLGGYAIDSVENGAMPSLGASIVSDSGGVRLTQVIAGGAAQAAGLSPGDELVAVEGERASTANLERLLRRAGDSSEVHYFRRGRLYTTRVQLIEAPTDTCELWLLPDESLESAVLERRRDWLASRQSPEAGDLA
jgi:predicted metalloprotease with PDZ domain